MLQVFLSIHQYLLNFLRTEMGKLLQVSHNSCQLIITVQFDEFIFHFCTPAFSIFTEQVSEIARPLVKILFFNLYLV